MAERSQHSNILLAFISLTVVIVIELEEQQIFLEKLLLKN